MRISLCLMIFGLVLPSAFCQLEINVVFQDLGCWNEDPEDLVFESWEGRHELLDGPYEIRVDPLQKCANVARMNGYKVFALREGGLCATGPNVERNFTRHGMSAECEMDGRGGIFANQVYLVNKIIDAKYVHIGCYKPQIDGLVSLEGKFISLMDDHKTRKNPQEKCARAAASLGHYIFGLNGMGFACYGWTHNVSELQYYPKSEECGPEGNKGIALHHLTFLSNITVINMGCWETRPFKPVLPSLESKADILGGNNYKERTRAIERCAIYNADKSRDDTHDKIFGITDGGACAGALKQSNKYDEIGPSDECPRDGRGSVRSMQVYKFITKFRNISVQLPEPMEPTYLTHLGCWRYSNNNPMVHLIPTLEGADLILFGEPLKRENPAEMCAKTAHRRGFEVFALIEGRCYSSRDARELFSIYGSVEECNKEYGGVNSMSVYEIGIIRDPWISNEGCYEDDGKALISLERIMPLVSDNPKTRKRAIQKCSIVASILHYNHFALLDGGRCHGLLEESFNDCVPSAACNDNGEGGRSAVHIYKIKEVNNFTLQNLGCWRDDGFRLIPLAEGASVELTDRYNDRENAIDACARYARSRGFKVFALQAGGMCMTSENAEDRYNWYGWSERCNDNGKGGPWANQVYKIHEDWWHSPVEWWKVPEPWKRFGGWKCTWQWWKTPEAPFL